MLWLLAVVALSAGARLVYMIDGWRGVRTVSVCVFVEAALVAYIGIAIKLIRKRAS